MVRCQCLNKEIVHNHTDEVARLAPPGHVLLIQRRRFRVYSTFFLDMFFRRFGACAKFNKEFPLWLKRMVDEESAEHVVFEDRIQTGARLDERVTQSVAFCRFSPAGPITIPPLDWEVVQS